MELLRTLGLNETVFIQFVIFLVVYLFLSYLLIKPYLKSYIERQNKTVAAHDHADELQVEIKGLELTYEKKAKEINNQIKEIYTDARKDSSIEFNKIIAKGQSEVLDTVEKGHIKIMHSIKSLNKELEDETSQLTKALTEKLIEA